MKDNVVNTKYATFDLMFTLDEIKMIYHNLPRYNGDCHDLANKIKDKMLIAGINLDKEFRANLIHKE